MNYEEKRDYFEQYLNRLIHELTMLDTKFELLKSINKHKKDRLEELNIAPAFFGIILNSLISDVIISLARFYENYDGKNRSDRNINKFLNFIESNINIFTTDPKILRKYNCDYKITHKIIDEHRTEINNAVDILDNLFHWRDKYFAHFDKEYFR